MSGEIGGWGRFPRVRAEQIAPASAEELLAGLSQLCAQPFIPRGNGRSYGDSALAGRVLSTLGMASELGFDEKAGVLECEAGLLLADIVARYLPRGWFPWVVPGTKLITVGGAIASDVHGKNHHSDGAFSAGVESLDLLLPGGEVLRCSASENPELFRATCGGMGLTGIILRARLRMRPVASGRIEQTRIRTDGLAQTLQAFADHAAHRYSVAWIDHKGRAILDVGDFASAGPAQGNLAYRPPRRLTVPFAPPPGVLANWSIGLFNRLYYALGGSSQARRQVSPDAFFWPLDALNHWNRVYGRRGFVQYQFLLPVAASEDGIGAVLREIARSGLRSFLSVLKLYGKANDNPLSFPMEGYGLAMDFPATPAVMALLQRLDEIVLAKGGRLYLAKDARMDRRVLDAGYPGAEEFRRLRQEHGLQPVLQSLQSQRLEL